MKGDKGILQMAAMTIFRTPRTKIRKDMKSEHTLRKI